MTCTMREGRGNAKGDTSNQTQPISQTRNSERAKPIGPLRLRTAANHSRSPGSACAAARIKRPDITAQKHDMLGRALLSILCAKVNCAETTVLLTRRGSCYIEGWITLRFTDEWQHGEPSKRYAPTGQAGFPRTRLKTGVNRAGEQWRLSVTFFKFRTDDPGG